MQVRRFARLLPGVGTAVALGAPDGERRDTHPRYGNMQVRAWGDLHPELERRGAWADHDGELPIIEGAVVNRRRRAPAR